MKPDTCKTENCNFFALEDDGYCGDCWFGGQSFKCPCQIADEPCQPNCPCINPVMSHTCYCCARHGSLEQRKKAANAIVSLIREKINDS